MTTRTAIRFTHCLLAAALIGMMAVGGSVWAKGSRTQTGAALGTARIDVQLLSVSAPSLPVMTIEQPF